MLDQSGDQVTELNNLVPLTGSQVVAWAHSNVWSGAHLAATYDMDLINGQTGSGTESWSAALHFHLSDPLGTRRAQINPSGQIESFFQSLPFGDQFNQNYYDPNSGVTLPTADDSTENHFTGKEHDSESGNDYFDARYYASNMGRFLTPDWSAQAEPVPYAKLGDPQTLNLYAYVGNNPLNHADPSGHAAQSGGTFPGVDPEDLGTLSSNSCGLSIACYMGQSFERTGSEEYMRQEIADSDYTAGLAAAQAEQATANALAQQQNNMQSAAGGPINTGPTNSTQNASNYGPWNMRGDALSFIDANQGCSDWLNSGGGNAHDLMSNVPINLVNASATDPNPPDGQTSSNPKAPIEVIAQGRFYANSVNGDPVAGRYQPGTYGARMTILFHELSHKLSIPGFLNDGFSVKQSMKNTELLLQHCIF